MYQRKIPVSNWKNWDVSMAIPLMLLSSTILFGDSRWRKMASLKSDSKNMTMSPGQIKTASQPANGHYCT